MQQRLNSSAPGINIGAYTYDQAKFDTREDLTKATITSEIYRADKRAKDELGDAYTYQDSRYLNAKQNNEVKEAVYEHIASVNSSEIVQESREARAISQEKRATKSQITFNMLPFLTNNEH